MIPSKKKKLLYEYSTPKGISRSSQALVVVLLVAAAVAAVVVVEVVVPPPATRPALHSIQFVEQLSNFDAFTGLCPQFSNNLLQLL